MKGKKQAAKNKTTIPSQPKGKKLLLFKALTILTPFIFLFFLELLLRLFSYGEDTSLFIKYPPDTRYMVMNYYASNKFFPDTIGAPKGNQEIFAINKAPNTCRIFVLGESTTIGYPFRPNGSFHRWLQYRLAQMYPDKNFEVINLSLTAVNSYTVLNFGKQLAQYQPDAVLIYTGHNEYYGALGIGSTTYVGSNRFLVQTLITLRGFKTVQLLNSCIKNVASVFASKKTGDKQSLMETMAARQHIALGSADYQAGINQFNANMTELCSTLNDEKIPVFLSTVVSNEKDLPPFVSDGSSPTSAAGYYNAGQAAYRDSSFVAAKQDLDKAKELDQLRFRAPEAINTSIKKIAGQYPYVHLVDAKKLFEQYSPHGIIGHETIMEHVHPTLFGYAILSEAFYRAMQQQRLIKEKPDRELTFDQLRGEMPITKVDSLMGIYQIMMLKTGWPFNQPIPKTFKVENSPQATLAVKVALGNMLWPGAMGQLYRYDEKTGNKAEQLKIAEAMVLQYPQSNTFYGYAGNLNATLKNYSRAAFYYKKLFMLTNNPAIGQTIFRLYLKAGDPIRALPYIPYNYAQSQAQTESILNQLINEDAFLKTAPNNAPARQRITANYKQLGIDTAFEGLRWKKANEVRN